MKERAREKEKKKDREGEREGEEKRDEGGWEIERLIGRERVKERER